MDAISSRNRATKSFSFTDRHRTYYWLCHGGASRGSDGNRRNRKLGGAHGQNPCLEPFGCVRPTSELFPSAVAQIASSPAKAPYSKLYRSHCSLATTQAICLRW